MDLISGLRVLVLCSIIPVFVVKRMQLHAVERLAIAYVFGLFALYYLPYQVFVSQMSQFHQPTMMNSVFCCIVLILFTSNLFGLRNFKIFNRHTQDGNHHPVQVLILDVIGYLAQFAWFFFPIQWASPRRTPRALATNFAVNVAIAGVKMIALVILYDLCVHHFTEEYSRQVSQSYLLQVIWMPVLAIQVVSGVFMLDILGAIIPIVTFGYLELLPFNDYALFPSSIRDFWGRRYNRLISTLLNWWVFTPLKTASRSSSSFSDQKFYSGLAAFTVSGLLHLYVGCATFGWTLTNAFRCFFFFVLHGGLAAADLPPANHPYGLKVVETWLLLLFSLPIYLGVFFFAYPAWLVDNPIENTVPTSVVEFVRSLTVLL